VNIKERAFRETGKRCAALIAFEPCVRVYDAIKDHHAMRIVAKKYRYTMEIFNDACDRRYEGLIQSIRALQEILGMIHDCDVWIITLQEQVPGNGSGIDAGDPDILALLEDRKKERRILYNDFVRLWDEFRERSTSQARYRVPAKGTTARVWLFLSRTGSTSFFCR